MFRAASSLRTLVSSEKLKHVAGPAGIAVDAMDVYWANLKAPLMGSAALMARGWQ